MVTVTVRYFAGLREAVGTAMETLKFEGAPTAAEAVDRVFAEHPEGARWRRSLMFAVNRTYARPEALLADGDELALIPPVSGGRA